MPSVPPARDRELNVWARNFHARVAAEAGGFDVPAAQVAALGVAAAAYDDALAALADPTTRTQTAVAVKRAAKAALLEVVRPALRVVGACVTLSGGDRANLGMRAAANPRPPRTAVPATRPRVYVDHRGRVRLSDTGEGGPIGFSEAALRGRKPAAVAGAFLFTAITPAGAPAPAAPDEAGDPTAARFAAMTTRMTYALRVPPQSAGATLWVFAQWCNRRGVPGPMSAPASVMIAA